MWWKKTLLAVAMIVVAFIAAVFLFLQFYTFNAFKPEIEQSVLEATGRRLSIQGDLKVEIGVHPVISVNEVALAGPSWGTRPDMAAVKEVEIEIALLPLMFKKIDIRRLILIDPELFIETNRSGDVNFELDLPEQTQPGKPARALKINHVRIENGTLTYAAGPSGIRRQLSLSHLEARLTDATGRIEAQARGSFEQAPFDLQLQSRLPAADPSLPLTLALDIAGATIRLDGNIDNINDLEGIDLQVKASGTSLADLARLAGAAGMPDPGRFHLAARVLGSANEPAIRDLKLDIGEPERVFLQLQGSVENPLVAAGIDLEYTVQSKDIGEIEDLLSLSLPWKGLFEASGHVKSESGGIYRIEDFDLRVARDRITASLQLDQTSTIPRIGGQMTIEHLDLRPVFEPEAFKPLQNEDGRKSSNASPQPDGATDPLRIEEVLGWGDGLLSLRVDRLLLPELSFGRFDLEANLTGGRMQIRMKGPALPDIAQLSGVTRLPELGPFRLSCDLTAAGDTLSMRDLELTAGSRGEAQVNITGEIANLTRAAGFEVDLKLAGDNALNLEKYLLSPWPLQGPFAVTGKMSDLGAAGLAFTDIAGDLQHFDFSGNVDVDWSGEVTRVSVGLAAERFNLRPFRLPVGHWPKTLKALSDMGPLKAQVDLEVLADKTAAQNVQIQAGRQNLVRLEVDGRIADLGSLQGIALSVAARGDDAAELEQLIGRPLPIRGPFAAAATFDMNRPGYYRFSDVRLSLADNRVTGKIDLNVSKEDLKLMAVLDSPALDLRPLGFPTTNAEKKTGLKNYISDTMTEDRRLIPTIPLPLNLSPGSDVDIRLHAARLYLPGTRIDEFKTGIELDHDRLDFYARSKALAVGGDDAMINELSTIGAIDLTVQGRPADRALAIESFRLTAGRPETIQLQVDGTIAEIMAQRGLDIRLNARGNDAAWLNRILKKDFRIDGPFEFSGRMRDPTYRDYRIENLKLDIADSDLQGLIDIDLNQDTPAVKAQLQGRKIDLRPFQPEIEIPDLPAQASEKTEKVKTTKPSRQIFSSQPFDLDLLRMLDLAVALNVDQFYSRLAALQDIDVRLELANGSLAVEPLRFTGGNGRVDGRFTIDQTDQKAFMQARFDLKDSDLGKVMDDLDLKRDIEGPIDLHLQVDGPFESPAVLMAGLNGTVSLYMRGGRIKNQYIGLIYADIGTTMLNLIKPLSQKDPMIDLNCLVVSFDIQDGVAKHAGLLDTRQTSLISAGIVDLGKERLDIVLKSNPKQRLRLPGVGSVGISLNELAKPFKLGGSLANPSLAVDPSASVATIGKLVGGFALLGPLGIAAALTDFSRDGMPPCERAEQIFEKSKKPEQQDNRPEPTPPGDTSRSTRRQTP